MKLLRLEWKQSLRSKFLPLPLLLYLFLFGLFFILNTKDNTEEAWAYKNELNNYNSQEEQTVGINSTEEAKKNLEERRQKKYEAYCDVLLSGFYQDRTNYPKDYVNYPPPSLRLEAGAS